MRIEVSGQEQELKEEQTGSPDGRSAAEPWQKKFSQQQLHLEQQKRARENSEAENYTSKDLLTRLFAVFHATLDQMTGACEEAVAPSLLRSRCSGPSQSHRFDEATKEGETVE